MAGTLIRTMRFVDDRVRRDSPDSLGVTELGVLGHIERGVDLPSGLARALRIDPSKVTRIVDQLVGHGYVERGIDSQDRRRCPLTLTDIGKSRLSEGRNTVKRTMDTLLERLPAGERDRLSDTLEHLREVLDQLPQS
jgi:DNA-binding MarR family transcriptional regulator